MKTLREWRRERLLTLAELAEQAGVTEKTIGEIERGRAQPHLSTIRKLCTALALPAGDVAEFAATLRQKVGETRPTDA